MCGGCVVNFPVAVNAKSAIREATKTHADPANLIIGVHGKADSNGEGLAPARARTLTKISAVKLIAAVGNGRLCPAAEADHNRAALLIVNEYAERALPALAAHDLSDVLDRVAAGPVLPNASPEVIKIVAAHELAAPPDRHDSPQTTSPPRWPPP